MALATYKKTYPALYVSICKDGGSICNFCSQVNIARSTFYRWVDSHPEFNDAFHRGKEHTEAWFTEMGIRGMKGEFEKFNATVWSMLMRNKCGYTEHRKVAIDFTQCRTSDEKMALVDTHVASGKLTSKEAKDYADYIAVSAAIHEKTEVAQRVEALEAQASGIKA